MIDVSIILVNYNTIHLLVNALDSLFEKCNDISYEVIVVDNNSSDNSREICKNRYGERVFFLSLLENVGFGRANNEGIKIAKGKNIFLLNPDTILLNNAVKILSEFLDNHINVAICGGNLYTRELEPIHSYLMYLPSLYSEVDQLFGERLSFRRYGNNLFFNHTEKPLNVGYVTGADMMIRKSVLDEAGYFDPDFFMYFEETELTFRIRKMGYDIMSVPNARIIHLEGQSIQLKENRENMFLQSRRLYLRKTSQSRIIFLLCQIIYGINALIHVLYFSSFRKERELLKIWKYRLKNF